MEVSMDVEKVQLTKEQEQETYLPTLYGKALDSRAKDPILGDKFADEVVRRIDLDFEKKFKNIAQGGAITLPMRAKHLDSWVKEFIDAHPESTVLNLGCGLDSRVFRINPPVTLRRRLYPERHDYEMIASSVTDLRWLDGIPGNRPVVVVAEGLMEYLPQKDAAALLNRITEQFPSGQIVFDAYSRLTVRILNLMVRLGTLGSKPTAAGTRVFLPWGMDDPRELEKQVPRLRLVTAVSFLTMPELVKPLLHSRAQAMLYRVLERFEWYRRSMQHLRYEF
jgi:O-methyltransferase involved in polyketide biosynthesis